MGVNSFTLDGNKDEIADAKDVLSKKGVTYKNIWFKSDSEAGKFTSNLFSFPTTYVIDQNGNIVGEPIVGAISSAEQRAALDKLIDQAIAKSASRVRNGCRRRQQHRASGRGRGPDGHGANCR